MSSRRPASNLSGRSISVGMVRSLRFSVICLIACGVLCELCIAGGPSASGPTHADLDRAVAAAVGYLSSKIDAQGSCRGEPAAGNVRYGAKTALCAYALLTAEPKRPSPTVRRALDWLTRRQLRGIYAVAMRAQVLAAVGDERYAPVLTADVGELIESAGETGAYAATLHPGPARRHNDNYHTAAAVLAVSSGPQATDDYWRRAARHWIDQQRPDGGWRYRVRPDIMRDKTYGSITAAGLLALQTCARKLHRPEGIQTDMDESIARAMMWLDQHYSIDENPSLGVNGYHEWVYNLSQVALASGKKYFGARNWRAEGIEKLIWAQRYDGAWGHGDAIEQTAFSLLFLLNARRPVLLNKLSYDGKWNTHPRDCANLTGWVSQTFKQPVRWEVVDINWPIGDLHDAPILYICGVGTMRPSDQQMDKLRRFILRGGLIISQAASNDTDFTISMLRLLKRLFPQYELAPVGDDHPIYSVNFTPPAPRGLWGISNGVRMLAVHSARELSGDLQGGPGELQMPTFEVLGNICLYATDRGQINSWARTPWPAAPSEHFVPRATIHLGRVKYDGNWDPEPLALRRLANIMARRHKIRLQLGEPVSIRNLSAAAWPVAHMTGTDAFRLGTDEVAALWKYVRAGGTLIVDAAGGGEPFARAAKTELLRAFPGGRFEHLSMKLLQSGPEPLETVTYRRDLAGALGQDRYVPRIEGLYSEGRLAIVFSGDDLTAALVGYPGYMIRGYEPSTAVAIMTNLVCHLSGVPRGSQAVELPGD